MKYQISPEKTFVIFLTLPLLFLFIPGLIQAQSFDEGLTLYENEQYAEAISVFQQLETPESLLFTGKSYYSLGEYIKAKSYLENLPENSTEDVLNEANFTSALVAFQLDQFGTALNKLSELKRIRPRTSMVNEANSLYSEILNYLTLAQRRRAFQAANTTEVKINLIQSAVGKVDYQTARLLFNELKMAVPPQDSSSYRQLEQTLSDSSTFNYLGGYGSQISAPRGIVYDIGAPLPHFKSGSGDFSVSQGLYQGYLLAAEEFNQRNSDKKVFIRSRDTGADMDSAGYAMNHLVWSNNVDAVLGPLFSESAMRVAELAEQYQIPVLAPLANADSLNIDNPYVFQANPTFASHGRKMAQHAVKRLKMDTLAIFAEQNSLGEISAYAFRREAEKLGAHISHFMVEDLASEGYDIAKYSKKLEPDTIEVASPRFGSRDSLVSDVEGLYAPFTGQAAPTLIDLLLIDLQVMDSPLSVLGSPEWGTKEIPRERLDGRTIYFTESFYINSKSQRVENFRQTFKQRFGREAERYAMIGYDSADFLLQVLERVENPALLKDTIKSNPLYEGLINNIKFGGTHVNQEVKVFKISDQGVQPAVY